MHVPIPPNFESVLRALLEFLRLEAAGGLVWTGAAVLAMTVANSPLAAHHSALLDLPLEVTIGTFGIAKPLLLWINDGLMAVFFFLVGLELKREARQSHARAKADSCFTVRGDTPSVRAVSSTLKPAKYLSRMTSATLASSDSNCVTASSSSRISSKSLSSAPPASESSTWISPSAAG